MIQLETTFNIGDCCIGDDSPCFIIAEAGSNHNRDLKMAFKLVDAAVAARADAVKFQTFTAETIASSVDTPLSRIQTAGASNLFELYKKLELPREWQREIYNYAKQRDLVFLSTPFDEKAVEELFEIGVEAFKIASFELCHFPLLRLAAQTGKPVLLSTGMATLGDIEEAIAVLMDEGCRKIGLFHCGIGYPMDPSEVNLQAMGTMKQAFPCPVGYSDHTLGIGVPIAAVSMGARLYEKHFTIDKSLPGPDHGFALDPKEFKMMISEIRTVEAAIGSKVKGPSASERAHKRRACRSIYSRVDMSAGTVVKPEMLAVLRPAAGLHPVHLTTIIGRRIVRDVRASEPITWSDFMR